MRGERRWVRSARAAAIVAAAVVAPLSLWGSSCVLEGFEQVGPPSPPPPPDVEVPEAGCPHATYPPPPEAPAMGGSVEFVVALRTLDLGDTPDGPELGLDLDLQCSCQGDGPTCTPLAGGTETCDGPEGRDNASVRVFNLLGAAVGKDVFSSQGFSAAAELGEWSVLLRVRDYNGEPDDGQVRLDWYIAVPFALGGSPMPPLWDGNDAWPISSESFDATVDGGLPDAGAGAPDQTKFSDPNAYVAGNVLVAALPSTLIRLAGGLTGLTVLINGGFVVARIEPVPNVGDGYALRDATLVGRWKVSEVFNSISSMRDEDGDPYCIGDLFYEAGKAQLCQAADILSGPGSPTLPCDALSMAIGFQTHPAKLGSIFTPPPPTTGCMPPETDPALDSCPGLPAPN